MSTEIKTAYRPGIEAFEGRILATAGLTAASSHGQAWVEITNESGRDLAYQVSFNEGQGYSKLVIRDGGSAFAHVNRADPNVLIRLKGESPTVLATGPSKQDAPNYTINRPGTGGMTVPPGPILGGGGRPSVGSNVGGTDTLPQTYVVLLNQSGGDVTLSFTNNNGRNYLNLTIGRQYFSLRNPFIVSLDQTNAGIKIQRPNGGGLQPLVSSPSLNSAPLYIINTNLDVFRS